MENKNKSTLKSDLEEVAKAWDSIAKTQNYEFTKEELKMTIPEWVKFKQNQQTDK